MCMYAYLICATCGRPTVDAVAAAEVIGALEILLGVGVVVEGGALRAFITA